MNELQELLDLLQITGKVGLTSDPDKDMYKHVTANHPENPGRLICIYKKLKELPLTPLDTRKATREEICGVHHQDQWDQVQEYCDDHKSFRSHLARKSLYGSPYIIQSCLRAVGNTIQAVQAVYENKVDSALAIVRPPGHHACNKEASGFCFFNNVAVAIHSLPSRTRVFILDWDVHHGDGTQSIFYTSPYIYYCSLHRFDNGHFFPCDPSGNHGFRGTGRGQGYNLNIPWNTRNNIKRPGGPEYAEAFKRIIIPQLKQFQPDLIVISAGFDAAHGDPLGGLHLTPADYAWMTHELQQVCPKIVLVLEGGYQLNVIDQCVYECAQVLLGDYGDVVDYRKTQEIHQIYQDTLDRVEKLL